MNGNKLLDTSLTTAQFSAQDNGIVPTMVRAAAGAKIRTQPVRRNISILEGSGGNIAVLTGPDGKLLVDAGFAVSRDAITNALTSINSDPIKHLINTHWHTDHTDGKRVVAPGWCRHSGTREHPQASIGFDSCRGLELYFSGSIRRRHSSRSICGALYTI